RCSRKRHRPLNGQSDGTAHSGGGTPARAIRGLGRGYLVSTGARIVHTGTGCLSPGPPSRNKTLLVRYALVIHSWGSDERTSGFFTPIDLLFLILLIFSFAQGNCFRVPCLRMHGVIPSMVLSYLRHAFSLSWRGIGRMTGPGGIFPGPPLLTRALV